MNQITPTRHVSGRQNITISRVQTAIQDQSSSVHTDPDTIKPKASHTGLSTDGYQNFIGVQPILFSVLRLQIQGFLISMPFDLKYPGLKPNIDAILSHAVRYGFRYVRVFAREQARSDFKDGHMDPDTSKELT
jgi:hypothetical protein